MENEKMNNENILPFKSTDGLFSKPLKKSIHAELKETTELTDDQITQVINRTDSAIAVYLLYKFKELCHRIGQNIGDSLLK